MSKGNNENPNSNIQVIYVNILLSEILTILEKHKFVKNTSELKQQSSDNIQKSTKIPSSLCKKSLKLTFLESKYKGFIVIPVLAKGSKVSIEHTVINSSPNDIKNEMQLIFLKSVGSLSNGCKKQ